MICEPDKVRFCDSEALQNRTLIHTVDLSDDRSDGHFITLWLKGAAGDDWAKGLSDHHKRELYHRDPPWIPATYPGMHRKGWVTHRHIDLDRQPQWQDLEPYLDEIPSSVQTEIKTYLGAR